MVNTYCNSTQDKIDKLQSLKDRKWKIIKIYENIVMKKNIEGKAVFFNLKKIVN